MKYHAYLIVEGRQYLSRLDIKPGTNRFYMGNLLKEEYDWVLGRDVFLVPAPEATADVLPYKNYLTHYNLKLKHDQHFFKTRRLSGAYLVEVYWRDSPTYGPWLIFCEFMDSGDKYLHLKHCA